MQRRNYFIATVTIALMTGLHCAAIRALPPLFVGFNVGASLLYTLFGVAVERQWLRSSWAGVLSALLSLMVITEFVYESGVTHSPYFQSIVALPFLAAMFIPDSRAPTLVAGVASLGMTVIMSVLDHLPLAHVLLSAGSMTLFVALALFGTRMYRRILEAQQSAQQERLDALAQLAESERRLRHAERERSEVERLVLVGQLAAGVAHEVNNPLAYVKANLNHLLREGESVEPGELKDVLTETQQGVLRIQQIVTDLRGFSRVGAQQASEQGSLEEAVGEATRLASVRLRNVGEVVLSLESALPAVRLGQRHMVQVVLNLLLNAVDAVEMARPGSPVHVRVWAWRVGDGVRLEVQDNGPGIPLDVMPRLFEPFFTTKPPGKGTGLGLALCREYVSRAGGSLHAENPDGGGARFVLLLPVAPEPSPAEEESPRPAHQG